jgi:hypothetical protein
MLFRSIGSPGNVNYYAFLVLLLIKMYLIHIMPGTILSLLCVHSCIQ